ncbi:MAG: hypothetical protein GY793_07095 [Proteobacteria bacterium]|nr:hypothetical protein [Pseudomonadota bacterium]
MRTLFNMFKPEIAEEALINPQNVVLMIRVKRVKPHSDPYPATYRFVPIIKGAKVSRHEKVVIWEGKARNFRETYNKVISEARRRITGERNFISYRNYFLEFQEAIGFFDPETNNMDSQASECILKSSCMETAIRALLHHCKKITDV